MSPYIMTDKIARICWNIENWKKPSGKKGKSKSKDSYEYQTGFGHEEWLLDTTKLIDGYHYSFLQAVQRHRENYIGKSYNISLYSINSNTRQRWWIGTINNVVIVDGVESGKTFKVYQKNNWFKEMQEQLKSVDADITKFDDSIKADGFVNIKFKPSDLSLLEVPQEFFHKDPAVKSCYYNLVNKTVEPKLIQSKSFEFQAGHNEGKSSKKVSYEAHSKNINLEHNKIQSAIYKQLIEKYGKENVGTENIVGYGNRIDLTIKHDKSFTFYEIKTGQSALKCIRESLGQLIEYANFNNDVKVKKLIVVSPNKLNSDTDAYLTKIRNKYSIPLYYQYFDMESQRIPKL